MKFTSTITFFNFVSWQQEEKGELYVIEIKDVVVGTKVHLNGKHYPYSELKRFDQQLLKERELWRLINYIVWTIQNY